MWELHQGDAKSICDSWVGIFLMLLSKGVRRAPSLPSWLQTSEMLEISARFLMEVRPESRCGTPKLVRTPHKSLVPGLILFQLARIWERGAQSPGFH